MKTKKFSVIMVLLLLIIVALNFSSVNSLGLRPAKTQIFTENTTDMEGSFWVVNNDQEDFKARIYVEGPMDKYIIVKTTQLQFSKEIEFLPVDFEVHLPKVLPPNSSAFIVVEPEAESNEPNVVSARISLKHRINLIAPYPDKYITTSINFHDNGKEYELVSAVKNLGKKDLENVQTTFYVNDKEQKQQTLETESSPLAQKEEKLLKANLDKTYLTQGEFEVKAVTTFDDLQMEVTKNLLVGRPEVDITYFDKFFLANAINPYSMDLLNKWNKQVSNVFVEVSVKKDDQKVDEFRTKSVEIEGLQTERINNYFNAKDKNPGTYSFDMVVNFWNTYKMETKTFHGELLPPEKANLIVRPDNVAGSAISDGSLTSTSTGKIILFSIIGLLVLGIGSFLGYRYKHREEYE
ncbi:hypothetical protein J4444_04200 [Candidatus Woesearchaeota archaeon]|nr:hypothetical protein [Candidatus Woesearchaeota archaeon]